MKMRNYLDERMERDIELFFKHLCYAAFLLIGIIGVIAFFCLKGCEEDLKKIQPVHFKESYTPTKFNKL